MWLSVDAILTTVRALLARAPRVARPLGAGGIETLTDALAERAWDIFIEIEGQGGLAKVISSGRLAAMVAEARESRIAKPIVGTTLFAMKTEPPVTVLGSLGDIGSLSRSPKDFAASGKLK